MFKFYCFLINDPNTKNIVIGLIIGIVLGAIFGWVCGNWVDTHSIRNIQNLEFKNPKTCSVMSILYSVDRSLSGLRVEYKHTGRSYVMTINILSTARMWLTHVRSLPHTIPLASSRLRRRMLSLGSKRLRTSRPKSPKLTDSPRQQPRRSMTPPIKF